MSKENIAQQLKGKFQERIIKYEEKSERRAYVDIEPAMIPEVAEYTFRVLGCRMVTATGIDTPQGIEILYHFSHDASGQVISLRTLLRDKKNPQIASLALIIKGADWIEREIWELLGVNFTGHPNLTHLLLIDDWPEGKHPLRKEKG